MEANHMPFTEVREDLHLKTFQKIKEDDSTRVECTAGLQKGFEGYWLGPGSMEEIQSGIEG